MNSKYLQVSYHIRLPEGKISNYVWCEMLFILFIPCELVGMKYGVPDIHTCKLFSMKHGLSDIHTCGLYGSYEACFVCSGVRTSKYLILLTSI
jgi:hypothetical protein